MIPPFTPCIPSERLLSNNNLLKPAQPSPRPAYHPTPSWPQPHLLAPYNVLTRPRSPDLLHNLLNLLLSLPTLQIHQREKPRKRQPHVPPNSNSHTSIVMAIKLVMLIRPNPRRDVVEDGSSHNSLRIRQRGTGAV